MTPRIINPHNRYQPPALRPPRTDGYLHIAAEIDPPGWPGPTRATIKLRHAIAQIYPFLTRTVADPAVTSVAVFRAVAFPPLNRLPMPDRYRDTIARYDLAILIRTTNLDQLTTLIEHEGVVETLGALHTSAQNIVITPARNIGRIADVPTGGQLYLFNHFLTENPDAIEVWDHLAGWYAQQMHLTNSEVIAPLDPDSTPFAFINHAAINTRAPRFIARQLSRPDFRSYVGANLTANQIGALPYFYKRLPDPRSRP